MSNVTCDYDFDITLDLEPDVTYVNASTIMYMEFSNRNLVIWFNLHDYLITIPE